MSYKIVDTDKSSININCDDKATFRYVMDYAILEKDMERFIVDIEGYVHRLGYVCVCSFTYTDEHQVVLITVYNKVYDDEKITAVFNKTIEHIEKIFVEDGYYGLEVEQI